MSRPLKTEVLSIDARAPGEDVLRQAASVLRAGGLVAFPTETVYGLGANALDAGAVARIYEAKGRPARNPIIVHVADRDQARALAAAWPPKADLLAACWPGPLTLVLPRSPQVPDIVTAGGPNVALRVPGHPVAHALIVAAGLPLAAPSANLSTRLSPTRAEHVFAGLDGRIDLILDGGPCPGGLESTVLDLSRDPPHLLRPGLLSLEAIIERIGPVLRQAAAPEKSFLPSPGLLERHYAPATPLELLGADGEKGIRAYLDRGERVGWVTSRSPAPAPAPGLTVATMPSDPAGYGARLYAVLHDLDRLGLDRIVVDQPPKEDAWLAVNDRLRRAQRGTEDHF